ncbi:MAG: lactate dehydrogenase [Phycisphaerae bacterium]|nr:lactate dehydrogenase [Phycisphaerae bacterium]MBM92943.1 lactate dehydrogenase [Phycisphaerae bacterium]
MNAVEIEQAVSDLFEQPFDPEEFPYQFLEAFGNKSTTIKKLRKGTTNKSDVAGGVLQRNNIHIAVCDPGMVDATMPALRESPATTSQKAKFILATDGQALHAENLLDDAEPPLICEYAKVSDHFGYFLELAGITTVKQIRENAFDIKATSRLNKLYIELLRENPDWGTPERREDLNHFFARLIFCFFAEDTNIFHGDGLFTATIEQMSESSGADTHEIISELFRSMNTPLKEREGQGFRPWAGQFPYVNGGLFSDNLDVPRFSKLARSYMIHIGHLDWKQINPDIFGSMIQAVADDEERGELGMHYTSVPNILKVLNPLFLDDLREKLEEAGDGSTQGSKRKLLNLRNRISRIRVFDPACGSGNFLVIAYKHMREIEFEINKRRGEEENLSVIPLTNFRGIEIRHFAAEIARLALVIAEFQCDVEYLGEKQARLVFLPLEKANWITHGNALRIDWLSVCPPTGTGVKVHRDDLFDSPLEQAEIDFENEGGEIFVCGNPPYKGRNRKGSIEREETAKVFSKFNGSFASLDYVANWIYLAKELSDHTGASAGLVATNSVCQGEQVALLWPLILDGNTDLKFAHESFQWSNLAKKKAGVTVVVLGIGPKSSDSAKIYESGEIRLVDFIGPYLVANSEVVVSKRDRPLANIGQMYLGNMPKDGGNLIMSLDDGRRLVDAYSVSSKYIRKFYGSEELIHARPRACLWIEEEGFDEATNNKTVAAILDRVRDFRLSSKAASTQKHASRPHRFVQISAMNGETAVVVPRVSSQSRQYLPADYLDTNPVIGDKCYALYDQPLWVLALVVSRQHLVWIATVCSRLRTDFSYGNKLGWNTFPVPPLTEQNKADLTHCAEEILLARERYWPATIADMYDPKRMDTEFPEVRAAHERNDEVLERIYIGRRFKNDTERLEKLFEMYTRMIEKEGDTKKPAPRKKKATS